MFDFEVIFSSCWRQYRLQPVRLSPRVSLSVELENSEESFETFKSVFKTRTDLAIQHCHISVR
jgi:hypothetical protein